ncbi:MAG: acetyl-CoA carboxylase biotin carboxylase subunit, partial [Candidatus Subteraquimicrobiales bacterium]|nr:acetyl-CoA carboxylase biotin carboxylase subunit [Candidatus Subteraquimicrobiales bacterium]
MFKKILVANRAEIALRVIRACKELGIKAVAVYSDVDRDCLHVKMADEAICIGPAQASASYLNIPAIVSAAEISGAEAIHPGYGFLAENAQFVEACESCNIVFIGPSTDAIKKMGNKAEAKKMMAEVGIPTIPGSEDVVTSEKEALAIANNLSYPVIIKAAAGGGGRGMRVVQNEKELKEFLQTASSEAQAAFGDSSVYLEKYIEEPRHIEIQILADAYGNVIHLGERDCSIQRRHQKLIEESPSPALDEALREKMGASAVRAAEAVNYKNAGTVEFLLDKNRNYHFMEMNTRVQVEHPVTEMVTGVDIVKEQIMIAMGEKLDHTQDDIKLHGHSIEFRINAEDPDKKFMPSGGRVTFFNPSGGPGVRVDSHLYSGYVVPNNYDSLLAKLIVWGETRE